MLIGIVPLLYAQFNSPNPVTTITTLCKIRGYVNQSSAMSCRWLLVMACIDRCLTCSMHARFRHVFTVKASRQIAAGLILIWMIIPIHLLIYVNIIPPGNIGCVILDTTTSIYHGLYTLIMGGFLPPIIMLICTISIWLSLKKKNERQTVTTVTIGQRRNTHRDQQVVIILLAQVVIYVISAIPFMANNFYANLARGIPNKPPDRVAIESFAQVITELSAFIFPASTFYCNTLVSRTFRQELFHMFKWLHPSSQRIKPNSQAITLNFLPANESSLHKMASTTANHPNAAPLQREQ